MNAYNIKIRRHYTDNKLLNNNNKKSKNQGTILYAVAVIWAIGFLGYHAGGIIHILLVIAVIAVILRVIQGKSIV